jgi:hypothetical protein
VATASAATTAGVADAEVVTTIVALMIVAVGMIAVPVVSAQMLPKEVSIVRNPASRMLNRHPDTQTVMFATTIKRRCVPQTATRLTILANSALAAKAAETVAVTAIETATETADVMAIATAAVTAVAAADFAISRVVIGRPEAGDIAMATTATSSRCTMAMSDTTAFRNPV